MVPAYPIPVPEGVPDWMANAILVAGGVAVFGVLLWQVVRYFRSNRDD